MDLSRDMVPLGGTFYETTIGPVEALVDYFYRMPGRQSIYLDAFNNLTRLLWMGDIRNLIEAMRGVKPLIDDGDQWGLHLWQVAAEAIDQAVEARAHNDKYRRILAPVRHDGLRHDDESSLPLGTRQAGDRR